MSSAPVLLSPALPTELLHYVLDHHVYPTTLVICSTRGDFLSALQEDIAKQSSVLSTEQAREQGHVDDQALDLSGPVSDMPHAQPDQQVHSLLSQTLSNLAISRHVRTVYTPSVTHLRSYLSVFSPDDSNISIPPPGFATPGRKTAALVIYGAIELHRDTSEWSVQGLGSTVATSVETANRLGWGLVMLEPPSRIHVAGDYDEHGDEEAAQPLDEFENLLKEEIPILSGSARRAGLDSEGGWSSRSVEVGRVMSRWFRLQRGLWAEEELRAP